MNEITKLYENAGISCKPSYVYNKVPILSGLKYPPFTAKKQLELIKWCLDNYRGYIFDSIETEWFEEQLCAFINDIWQDLTEEEKQQVKEILNG